MRRTALLATVLLMMPSLAAAETGENVYKNSCAMCHQSGAVTVPQLGDQAAWTPLAEKGIDALLASVKAGKGGMPPRATCMTCSDDDYRAAIQYMIDAAK